MGTCLIQMNGADVNTDGLTASEPDVLKGKTFIGNKGIEQSGSLENRGSPSISLPVNGTYNFPSGYYAGGTVKQNIGTSPGTTISPGNTQKTAQVSGKYMSGNIIVNGVDGLVPGNIKKGVTVGGVTGTYEGFENNDPNRPYYRGTFYEGQGLTKLRALNSNAASTGQISFQRDHIVVYCGASNTAPVCVLDGIIDFSKYKNVEVLGTNGYPMGYVYFFQNWVSSFLIYHAGEFNPALGTMYMNATRLIEDSADPGVFRLNDGFNVSQQGYCYFNFNRAGEFNIRIMRFIPK